MIVHYCKEIDRLELYFKYHLDTIEQVKQEFSGRKWDGSKKCWTIPFSDDNLDKVKGLFLNVKYSDELIRFLKQRKKENPLTLEKINQIEDIIIDDFEFITNPYKFQKISFQYARINDCSGMLLDMGLGKTKITIDVIRYRLIKELIDKVLIIVPNNLIDNWLDEFTIHSNIKENVIGILNKRNKNERIKELYNPKKFIFLLNYEGLLVLKEELKKINWDMIVCDESTNIKNYKAKRTKILTKFSNKAKYRMILTGTPTGNSVIDLFGQFLFLDRKIFGDSYYAFRNTYCIMGGFKEKQIVGVKNYDKLITNLSKRCIRFNKEDCLDLPPRIFVKRKIDMSKEQSELSLQVINDSIVMMEDEIITTTREAMKQSIKLSQINGGFIRGDDGIDVYLKTLSPKVDETINIIDESGSIRIIIWCAFVTEVLILQKVLGNKYGYENVFAIFGEVDRKDRKELYLGFKTPSDNIKILIMTIDLGAWGLNLQVADLMIYYSCSYKYLLRTQSLERNYRTGQVADKVTVIDLMINDSIDEHVYKAIEAGKDLEKTINDPLNFFRRLKNGKKEKTKTP